MASHLIAHRVSPTAEFTCSLCGGHEAYTFQSQSAFVRYLLHPLMMQPARCCDCDTPCNAFPARVSAPVARGVQRTAPLSRSTVAQSRVPLSTTPQPASEKVMTLRDRNNAPLPVSTQILAARTAPTPARSFRPVSGWAIGAGA